MFHQGTRTTGGHLSEDQTGKIGALLDDFMECVQTEVQNRNLRRAVVRSMLPCSLAIIMDVDALWIAAQKHSGMPSTQYFDCRQNRFLTEEIFVVAKWDVGFDDPFIINFHISLIDLKKSERQAVIESIARDHVDSELNRVNSEMNIIQINPIFGPAHYKVDSHLVFILMPFTEELTEIYNVLVKPVVEEFGLICRRADDIKSNKVIIQDIWKSICEARIIVADMSDLNPNVMYELGIAHTLGKETILLYRKTDKEIKFPFDLSHIRRIEYKNTVPGSKELGDALRITLKNVLHNQVII